MDELFEELWSTQYRISGDQVQAKDWARDFLDGHAHQLAEKIRNSNELRGYTDGRMGDCNRAADLIDPKAASADPAVK